MGRVWAGRVFGVLVVLTIAACGKSPTAPSQPPAPTEFSGPAAATIILTPSSADLPAGGGSVDIVIVTSGNEAGNVIAPRVTVALEASSGTLSAAEVRTDSTGHARVTWTGTSAAIVTARAGDIVSQATIRVPGTPPAPPPPNPNPNPTPNPEPNPNPTPNPNPNPNPNPTPDNGVSVFWSVSPAKPVAGEPATFTATVTSRPDAPVASYAWDFTGDGVTDSTAATPTHAFASGGRQAVSVTVTLTDGRTAVDGGGLDVAPSPAPAIATTLSASPSSVAPGDAVTLTATATPNSTAGTVTSYEWDFDNNATVDRTTTTPSTTTSYSTIGTKTAKVTAKSATGAGSATATIAVSAPPLTISSFTVSGTRTAGSTLTFTVTVSSTGSVPPTMTFGWDYEGDGTVNETTSGGSPRSVSHIYNAPGTYTVKVTVTAPDGRTVTGTAQVTIS